MKIRVLLVALTILSAPAALTAQHPAPRSDGAEQVRRGPVEMLLRNRERFRLSGDQVARLEAIGRRMEERNQPLVARLLEMRRALHGEFRGPRDDMSPAERAEFRRRAESARPLLREIRQNNRAAMREVGEVLTPEQKDQVREFLREHREQKGSDGRRRRGRGR